MFAFLVPCSPSPFALARYAVSQATGVRGVLIYTAGTAGTFSRSVKMLNWTGKGD